MPKLHFQGTVAFAIKIATGNPGHSEQCTLSSSILLFLIHELDFVAYKYSIFFSSFVQRGII